MIRLSYILNHLKQILLLKKWEVRFVRNRVLLSLFSFYLNILTAKIVYSNRTGNEKLAIVRSQILTILLGRKHLYLK